MNSLVIYESVAAENVASIDFGFDIVEAWVVTVGYYGTTQ